MKSRDDCPPLCELGRIFRQANQPNVVMPSETATSLDLAPVANGGPLLQGPPRAACARAAPRASPATLEPPSTQLTFY
jgi:hypothetical protein